jgi:hypothetical protein
MPLEGAAFIEHRFSAPFPDSGLVPESRYRSCQLCGPRSQRQSHPQATTYAQKSCFLFFLYMSVLHHDRDLRQLQARLTAQYERDFWIIHIDRLMSKLPFLKYAARYVCRPPIATYRLLEVTDRDVMFLAKIGKKLIPTKYSIHEFTALLAEHVPDRYRHAIRHFGLFAPTSKGRALMAVFWTLGQQKRSRPRRLGWRQSLDGVPLVVRG